MLKVAITGNIASGKSQVERFISDKYRVFDADTIAHQVLDNLTDFYGYDVYTDGKIDRKKLGKLVFNNNELRMKLEEIIHPKVKIEILKIFETYKSEKMVFVSVPLLFEAKFDNLFDKIVFIQADDDLRLKRLMQRNNLSKEEAILRMNSQQEQIKKINKSDFVIENNYDLSYLESQVKNLLENLI